MDRFRVEVLKETADEAPSVYFVRATTQRDAVQLAFALDGGWSQADGCQDASEMLALAQEYCLAERV